MNKNERKSIERPWQRRARNRPVSLLQANASRSSRMSRCASQGRSSVGRARGRGLEARSLEARSELSLKTAAAAAAGNGDRRSVGSGRLAASTALSQSATAARRVKCTRQDTRETSTSLQGSARPEDQSVSRIPEINIGLSERAGVFKNPRGSSTGSRVPHRPTSTTPILKSPLPKVNLK